jgi:DNA-binding protein
MDTLNKVIISVPISKIDRENRIVSGFATLNNVDKQGDLITAKASRQAFEKFAGNLRPMHNPVAIGRLLSFKEETYFDANSGETYDGIYVDVYVSKGAQDDWEKVLDKTYTGFSIGGRAKSKQTIVKSGSPVRVIDEMELFELSLVDSPANKFASILSIQKNDNGEEVMSGISSDIKMEDVFYCKFCEILAPGAGTEEKNCMSCQEPMKSIGWIENIDGKNLPEKMIKMLEDHQKTSDDYDSDKADTSLQINKGGDLMGMDKESDSVEIEKSDDASKVTLDETNVIEKSAPEEEAEAVIEKSDSEAVVETVEKSDEISAEEKNIKDFILSALEDFATSQVDVVTKAVAGAVTQSEEKLEFLKKEFIEAIDVIKNSFEERVSEIENSTAIKKSGELGGSTEIIKKGVWNGVFTPKHFFDSNSIIE